MKYFISRQHYWDTDNYIVEVAGGGLDFANPDMLVPLPEWRSRGDGKEFNDPRKAVEAAIEIRNLWRAAGCISAEIGCGFTHGFTLSFEPISSEEAEQWAEKEWTKLPKCNECEKILGEDWYELDPNLKYCSFSCLAKANGEEE